ncbi:MAG: RNA polymerase II transcription factor B subunit 1 [Trizodia sp. TS-e1964]|nr:MAG: RNA polymerase II transcription factor B subunit 1 [Trizodia sp. TS-e1964]
MPPPRASTTYKKKEGTLALARDLQSVTWTPDVAPGAVTIHVSDITNLQQTPASNAKVMLKVFAQPPSASKSETHLFAFTSATSARAEADAIKDALSKSIATARATNGAGLANGGVSASLAMASATNPVKDPKASWWDDSRLKADIELQQSLLKSDPSLQKTFMESLRTKPETITNSQFTAQFWSTRTHLLRAHAIEKNQSRGAYNVLSTIKPTSVDNVLRLSVSKEQIHLIFNQHPLVKRVYDENVPRLSEDQFWSKFFQSRLFKKLKGERLGEGDPHDTDLDKYLHNDTFRLKERPVGTHIPHIIDLEGNEENHSQKKGNKPDFTMRPNSAEKVPIIRTLNSLSEMIMAQVAPNGVDPSEPIGMDEETFNELALRDLQGDAKENRIILKIREQRRLLADDPDNDSDTEDRRFSKQDPSDVLQQLQLDLDPSLMESNLGGGLDLQRAIGIDESEDEDVDEADSAQKPSHVGSKQSISAATTQILAAVAQSRAQRSELGHMGMSAEEIAKSGLSTKIFDRMTLTHATTTEFLHHFWLAFLSGDSSRAAELSKHIESLDRAMDRMNAVAADAEAERAQTIQLAKKGIREQVERTGKRPKEKFSPDSIKGGDKAVRQMLGPTIKALKIALRKYEKAVEAEGME